MLVVGGAGILAPAAQALGADGTTVLIVGRRQRESAPRPWAMFDARSAREWSSRRAGLDGWAGASVIAYEPAVSSESLDVLTADTVEPRVLVRPSAVAAPEGADDAAFTIPELAGWTQVVLGWHPDGSWHDSAEISAAALDAWRTGCSRVLGIVRPWEGRPS